MKPTNIIKSLVTLSAPLLLWGCSDDAFNHDTPLPGEQFEGIMLSIPNVVAPVEATRAVDDATFEASEAEAKINKLTILAYPINDTSKPTVIEYSDAQLDNVNPANTQYKKIPVVLTKGSYHIYVLAKVDVNNINSGDYNDWEDISETTLSSANLTKMGPISASKIPSTGLPMSCNYTSLTTDGVSDTFANGVVNITSGMSTDVFAPLTFAVAKVRVTLLNEQNPSLTMGGAALLNGANSVNLLKPTWLTDNTVPTFELTGAYKSLPTPTNEKGEAIEIDPATVKVDGLTDLDLPDGKPTTTWAWQGVWYIPERLYKDLDSTGGLVGDNGSTPSSDYATINLSFSDNNEKSLIIGSTEANSGYGTGSVDGAVDGTIGGADSEGTTSIRHIVNPTTGEPDALHRSTFYDYVGTANGVFYLKVMPWDIEKLEYTLHGPYELIVEDTKMRVASGIYTKLWFHSDTEVTPVSPKYTLANGEVIDFYQINKNETNDSIIVTVNPRIPLNIEKESLDDYSYFHLNAGNLMKRIEVKPLEVKPFLTLSRENITIDVREIVGSGSYEGILQILMTTNVEKVKLERDGTWDDSTDGNKHENAITLNRITPQNTTQQVVDGDKFDIEQTQTLFNLNYAGLNSGWDYWAKTHTMRFKVIPLDADGNQYDPDLVEPRTVTINVLPNIQNYTIHFRADGWSKPHIYVYQCLEFPAISNYPNVPVAADSQGLTASLEYSFTGKISFLGWNVGEFNNPNAPSTLTAYGFRYFNNDTDSWNWLKEGAAHWKHYNSSMDFCETYRKTCSCDACREGEYATVWPGIVMEDEKNNGWWKFELTGVATPGKALIMFSDFTCEGEHANAKHKTCINRYPADNQVGIPLFDYPSKEGWFDYNPNGTNQFTSTNPDNPNYRLYWPKSIPGASMQFPYIWISDIYEYDNAERAKEEGDYYYVDFEIYDFSVKNITFLFKDSKSGGTKYSGYGGADLTKPLIDFSLDGSLNRKCYTWTKIDDGYGGRPK
jgi:hypothetical protein